VEIANHFKNDDSLYFVMAGNGNLYHETLEQIKRYGLESKVYLPGFVDTRDYLKISNLLILPSEIDGRPNAVLESLSMAVPVIASSVGGLPKIIKDEYNGFLCASGDIEITGFKGYMLYKIQTSAASWVRLYTDSASRTADNSRLEGTDPLPGAGVIAEVITTGASTILISPGAFGFNNESSVSTNIPVRVTNKSGATTDITVTLVVVQLEA
jgi:hypothetical protein